MPAGYLMVLRQGDDILKEIEQLAINENIQSANFTGMGFVKKLERIREDKLGANVLCISGECGE